MIRSMVQKIVFILSVFLTSIVVHAAVPKWQIIPSESSITFTGTQNDAPASGSFKKFSGEIQFDPDQLNASTVRMIIDMNSVATSYADLRATLISSDWFDVKLFPQAVFTSTHFKKIGDNQFQADGTLTIRDKSIPVMLTFVSQDLAKDKKQVKGNVILKRTEFGIGRGEWADTDTVKDDVQVNFMVTGVRH